MNKLFFVLCLCLASCVGDINGKDGKNGKDGADATPDIFTGKKYQQLLIFWETTNAVEFDMWFKPAPGDTAIKAGLNPNNERGCYTTNYAGLALKGLTMVKCLNPTPGEWVVYVSCSEIPTGGYAQYEFKTVETDGTSEFVYSDTFQCGLTTIFLVE